jgi:hypothetical protein
MRQVLREAWQIAVYIPKNTFLWGMADKIELSQHSLFT